MDKDKWPRRRIAFAASALAILFGVISSGAAQAATWTVGPTRFDSDDTECGAAYDGKVWVKAKWDQDNSDPAKVRLNSDYDIVIINQSAARIPIYGWTSGNPNTHSFTWNSGNSPAKEVSAYRHPSNIINVNAFETEVFSVDNPDRWQRIDGVSDSNPSPHSTPMAWTRDPFLSFWSIPEIYVNGSWHSCGRAVIGEVFFGTP